MGINVTKADLVASAAGQAKITKTTAEKIVNQLFDTIERSLVQNRDVTLVGFGTFSVGVRQARQGRNPQTKKLIQIPETRVAKFKPGKLLKEAVDR